MSGVVVYCCGGWCLVYLTHFFCFVPTVGEEPTPEMLAEIEEEEAEEEED